MRDRETHFAAMPFPVLIGDVGGTNARFALLADRDTPPAAFHSVATADFPDIESAVEEGVFAYSGARPRSAVIALAGPIVGDAVDLTNAPWIVRPRDMIRRLGVEEVVLLNDFEALALSLTMLDDEDLVPVGGVAALPGAAKVVVGPGTGLGVAALLDAGGIWVPVPGEGGHVALGPAEPDEFLLWPNIESEHGRVCAETLLCGRGLVTLYRAVARTDREHAAMLGPGEITAAALREADPLATKTLKLYCRLLGRLAGDMALIFMARGGVYVGGGIAPHILPFLADGEFRRAFEAKAPYEALMAQIPIWVITSDNPAFPGLAGFARAPDRFGVNLSGRRWLK